MGFKSAWAQRQAEALESASEYGEGEPTSAYKAASALNTLYASDYNYDEWKNIGIAFKCAGGELSDWLAWCSIDASRYSEREATRLYKNVDVDGAITARSLWRRAWGAGWEWHEHYTIPKVKQIPETPVYDSPEQQAITQLRAMFKPDEYVNIVTKTAVNKNGKLTPSGYGRQYVCSELCEAIKRDGLETAIGGYNHEAGVWLRVNPMNGCGISDEDVTSCRNALVESDDMPIADQKRLLFELNLPIVCVTNSGGKSLHAIVKIDADGVNHYRDRVQYLHAECLKAGMTIDQANKNPGRLTRLAGVQRGEREQTLTYTRIGARDFKTWAAQKRELAITFDHGIEPLDMETPISLDQVIIEGVMRRGDKMCVAGPSKAYKSFALVELAISMACGLRWLGWECRQGRVLYINCELRPESFRKRVWDLAEQTPGASREAIAQNIDVWNMRGRTQPLSVSKAHIQEQAATRNYDLIILDPIYKLFDGDENNAQDVSAFMLAMDELATRLHASIVYCHHHAKGAAGGKSAQDRFSGSGVFARDCDELIDISPLDLKDDSITDWGYEPGASAWRIETVIRDFAPKAPLNVVFEYPLHHVDTTGFLDDYKIVSPQSMGGNARGKQKSAQRRESIEKLERWCAERFKFDGAPIAMKELTDTFKVTAKTMNAWINDAPTLRKIESGRAQFVVKNDRI